MAETITYTGELKVYSCWCGISFALPESLYTEYRRKNGGMSIYCPLGHGMIPRNKDEIAVLKARLASAQEESEHYRSDRNRAERQARAHKGHHTRTKNRIANGVCPCCNRTFVNLGKHMKSQHPDFAPKGLEQEVE